MGCLMQLQALIYAGILLVLGLIALLVALVLAQGALDAWWKIALFALLPCVLLEGAVEQTVVALSIDRSRVARLAGGRTSMLPARWVVGAIVIAAGIVYSIALVVTHGGSLIVAVLLNLALKLFPLSNDTLLVFVVLAAYAVTRPLRTRFPDVRNWLAPASTYRLSPHAVTIVPAALIVRRFSGSPQGEFTVPFAELDRVEVLSGSGEADAVASALGVSKRRPPDSPSTAESNTFSGYYWEGDPSRPRVLLAYGHEGRPVALVGPDRRYVISFRDTDELIAAWQRYRDSHPARERVTAT